MIGQTLSHFKIVSSLGAGGMGEVYRAVDTQLGREVAVKVIPEAVAGDPRRLARLEREAKMLASLNHPNIAAIYSIESATRADSETGSYRFLVMELVEGEVLKDRLQRGPLPVREVLNIALHIAEALEAAHLQSIIHRDLKPGNVIVTADGKVKVLDFGLATQQVAEPDVRDDAPTVSRVELTEENQIVGTVPYMSPEQIRSRPTDPRSDLFSLGVVCFEMLSGQRPFEGETSVDVISSILCEPTPDLAALRPGISAPIADLIADCLAKDPDQRPASATVVRQRLDELLKAATTTEEPGRTLDRPPCADADEKLAPRTIAVLPFINLGGAEEAEFLATGLHNDLVTELSKVSGLTVISRSSVVRYRETSKTPPEIGRELGAGTIIEGTVQSIGSRVRLTAQLIDAADDVQRWAERYDRELSTETLFDLQSEVTHRIVESLQSRLAPTLKVPRRKAQTRDMESYRLVTLGRVQVERRTETGCRRAVEHFRAAVERDPDYAPAWAGLAEALAISVWYGYVEPGDRLQRAQRAAQRAVALDHDSAEAHCSLATSLGAMRQGPQALQELELAVQLQPSFWDAHNRLSYLNTLHGRASEALAAAKRAVELNPLSAEAVSNLSLSSLTTGAADRALREARRSAELSPGWSTATFYEALPLYEMGQYDRAVELLSGTTVEWAGLGAEATLAISHLASGDRASAREVLQGMDPHVDAFAVGLVHLASGETDEAFQRFSQAEDLNDWACIAIHHLYRRVWGAVANDVRYSKLVERAYTSHNIDPKRDVTF